MYEGEAEFCKEKFRAYLLEKVVTRTEDTDNALKKFFKGILQKLAEVHSEAYTSSNIIEISD